LYLGKSINFKKLIFNHFLKGFILKYIWIFCYFIIDIFLIHFQSYMFVVLGQVEEGMLISIQDQCLRGVEAYAVVARIKWVLEWPGQVVLVVSAIYWTSEATIAIIKGGDSVQEFENFCTRQLGDIVNLVRGELTFMNRMTLSALVVMDVHARDTIALLVREKVSQETDFLWQSQLRMYWEKTHVWFV
jgi:dynein heavy chain